MSSFAMCQSYINSTLNKSQAQKTCRIDSGPIAKPMMVSRRRRHSEEPTAPSHPVMTKGSATALPRKPERKRRLRSFFWKEEEQPEARHENHHRVITSLPARTMRKNNGTDGGGTAPRASDPGPRISRWGPYTYRRRLTARGKLVIDEEREEGANRATAETPSFATESVTEAMKRTRILPFSRQPSPSFYQEAVVERQDSGNAQNSETAAIQPFCAVPDQYAACAIGILQHSYLERLCGPVDVAEPPTKQARWTARRDLPEDPTVQESIECVFASQLEEGLPHYLLEDDDEEEEEEGAVRNAAVVPPSQLQQSLLRSRSSEGSQLQSPRTTSRRKQRVYSKLVHIGSMDPYQHSIMDVDDEEGPVVVAAAATGSCSCRSRCRPNTDPEKWPQRPVLLRPTPASGTVVRGIRLAGSREYLWEGSLSTVQWPHELRKNWKTHHVGFQDDDAVMCPCCMILPINNGNEAAGESVVTDFASELFEGTLLLRVRGSEGTTAEPYDDNKGYFCGVNRRYQVVIRGRFKEAIPWTDMVTGFQLDRPCGKLPAKWIVKGALNVVHFFAPQLQARLDGPHPSCLTPLGSTPQSIIVEDSVSVRVNMEQMLEEPSQASVTLLGKASKASSSMQRARYRKKAFDRLFAEKNSTFLTDPSKTYTFEFLQHLINFDEFTFELGSMFGSVKLKPVLDGQPLQIMATAGSRRLWSFDLWHENLIDDAIRQEQMRN